MTRDPVWRGRAQVPTSHYHLPLWREKGRFASWWHQLHEIEISGCSRVLEVGVGTGFLRRELAHLLGVHVVSMDVDAELLPDVVGDVRNLPFETDSFPATCALQVLEHLPWHEFKPALLELRRVASRLVLTSLPDRTPFYHIRAVLPLLPPFEVNWSPPATRGAHSANPSHFWEIGLHDYPLRRITQVVEACSLRLVRTYRVPEHPYHRIFVMEMP